MIGSPQQNQSVATKVRLPETQPRTSLHRLKNQRLRAVRTYLRARRHRMLCGKIIAMPAPVRVLDVGGSPFFWETLEEAGRCQVTFLNQEDARYHEVFQNARFSDFQFLCGDGRDMSGTASGSYDLVVCNSVLEHVGQWWDMIAAARELARVGKHGWVQIPAIECPIEPHMVLPFVHWFHRPLQRRALELFTSMSAEAARTKVDGINLVSRREMRLLFPDAQIMTERVVMLPKSHLAVW